MTVSLQDSLINLLGIIFWYRIQNNCLASRVSKTLLNSAN